MITALSRTNNVRSAKQRRLRIVYECSLAHNNSERSFTAALNVSQSVDLDVVFESEVKET